MKGGIKFRYNKQRKPWEGIDVQSTTSVITLNINGPAISIKGRDY